jgi:hypothetical protein
VVVIGPAVADPDDQVPESWQRSQYLATAR